jgi:chromosome segregation ATPase
VAVAGLYRTGKSYLLNRILLNRKNGFGVGPTINPCTKGLWVWAKPISGTTADGENCSVVIVDTEGIGALDESSDHDSRIFSLAILVSSFFIYNSVGSIDEEALQNLSLVVNLTKHIHIKSQQTEDIDYEDYAAYFPAFLWVVRDFTLQLIDQDGNSLTAKEYLEKALQNQKGFSDAVEEKNRIRKMIKSFFPDRDCSCLVRPVTKEQDLQNLVEKEIDELRIEFVEQMVSLRQRVLARIKPKMLQNKKLNGEMFSNLILSYVDSINSGSVPSIESAWSYICKTECSKAADIAQDLYEKIIWSSVSHRLPVSEDELKLCHREAKEAALESYLNKAVGNLKEEFMRTLKDMLSEKYNALKADNELETQRKVQEFLSDNYYIIDQRLINGDFKSLSDYERELRAFMKFTLEHGPQGPHRREIVQEFCISKFSAVSDRFVKILANELEIHQQITSEKIIKLESELRENKEEILKDRDEWQRRLTTAESDRTELSIKESSLREQLQGLKMERDRVEKELRDSLKSIRSDSMQQVEDATSKVWQFEDRMKEMERSLFQKESEFQEQKLLYDQKIQFLETNLEETRKKEKEYLNELKNQKRDHTSAVKDLHSRHESQIKNYQTRVEMEAEKVNELERRVEELETLLDREKSNKEESELNLKSLLDEASRKFDQMKQQSDRKENEFKKKLADLSRENENVVSKLKSRLDETEKKLKFNEENFKSGQANYEKDNAILIQKLEFTEQQFEELKQQLDEERRRHENMMRAFHSVSNEEAKEEVELQLQKLREQYADDMRKIELEFEGTKKRLTGQLEELRTKNSELELHARVERNDWESKERQANELIAALQSEKATLNEKLQELEGNKSSMTEEGEFKMKKRIKELESQIENMQGRASEEIQAINLKSEQTLAQVKYFYDQEKMRLEQRLIDEKERAEKKYGLMCEEYEDRIRQEVEALEEEINNLNEDMSEMHATHTEDIAKLRHQNALDSQKIETLEKYLKETRDNLDSMQKSHTNAMEQQLESFKRERNNLLEKVEKLASDLSIREREFTSLTYEKEKLDTIFQSKLREIDELRAQFSKEKSILMDKLDSAKEMYQKVGDEFTQKKSDFKREIALKNQQVEFMTKKITDLERTLQESEERYNETLKSLKDESGQELSSTIEKLTHDKHSLEQRLNERKKAMRELETSSSRTINNLEKEKAVLSEKLANTESKKNELEKSLRHEIDNLNVQLKEAKEVESHDQISVHLENERLKTLLAEKDKEILEKMSSYERDKTLWENKFNFLTSQRDQARNDLNEAQRKFEQTLDQVKKRGASDKDKLESATSSLIASIEARYTSQIKDLQDNYQGIVSDLSEKNRNLEKEVRSMREELELERRNRNHDSGSLEKKVTELAENERRLLREIENIKKDRENKLEEMMEVYNLDKEQLRNKISEFERRAKEAEQQRGQLFLEHEKERAKWALERDHLIAQKNEAQDIVERLEKRKDALLRENEKLKADRGVKNRVPSMGSRKEGSNVRPALASFLASSGMSFEEFTKEKAGDQSGSTTPNSSNTPGDVSPKLTKPPGIRAMSPIGRERPPSGSWRLNRSREEKPNN